MRIAVSNPDNIGDFVLRQPMLSAFLEAGHELLLIVRDFVAPLAADLFPQAIVLQCVGNPYERGFELRSALGQEFLRQVKEFRPDVVAVAAYQHTALEELLAEELPEADWAGFTGHLFQARPEAVEITKIPFTTRVAVAAETRELRKNELLCAAVLGRDVSLPAPRIKALPEGIAEARLRLAQAGLSDAPFWVVCAGDIADKSVKNWTREQWAEFCRTLLAQHPVNLLFAGSTDEHAATTAIRAQMGDAGLRTATITNEPATLRTLTGILQLSEGYIGKDTGPMHMAAALGKPVVAVFGGGHWPRFVPAAQRGAVFTVSVPCTGCNWSCHLQRSHCVKDIPIAAPLAAAGAAIRGELTTFSEVVIAPDSVLHAAILRELWESAQKKHQLLEAERANFLQWHDDRLRDIANLQGELAKGQERVESAESLLQTWNELGNAAVPEDGETFWLLRDRLAQLGALAAKAKGLEEQMAAVSFQEQLAATRRWATDTELRESAARLERYRQSALRKIVDARARIRVLQEENGRLTGSGAETGAIRDELAGWQAKWRATAEEVEQLRGELESKDAILQELQAHSDADSLREHRELADHEILLARKEEELHSALTLIPELRDELAWERERLHAEIATINSDRQDRLVVIEALSAQLDASEADRAARLRVIEQLQETLLAVEEDRKSRGEQIVTLHEIIGHLQKEIEDLHNLLPYRILRKFL